MAKNEEHILTPLYDGGYGSGQVLNSLIADLIKTKGFEQTKKYIESLISSDEPQYDMNSRNPFGV